MLKKVNNKAEFSEKTISSEIFQSVFAHKWKILYDYVRVMIKIIAYVIKSKI